MMSKETVKPIVKTYFDIKLEVMAPITLTYRVLAEDEKDALDQIKNKSPNNMKPNLSMKRLLKATVYTAGSTMVKLVKSFR
jgi:hypothetical protein